MDPDRLYATCSALLGAVCDAYDADTDAKAMGAALPPRRYVHAGLPAWDGPQVSVYVERVYPGLPAAEQAPAPMTQQYVGLRTAHVWCEILRSAPVPTDRGKAPTPQALDTMAQVLYTDAIRMAEAVRVAYRAGKLGEKNGLTIGGWEPVGPEGGLVGGRLRVDLVLAAGV